MKTLTVQGLTGPLTFAISTTVEQWRAETLLTKEPGTIQWLQENLHPGDVFYDIGANIGCYTLLAAQLMQGMGHIYAFEPHVGNAAQLLRNVQLNGFHNVSVLSVALGQVTRLAHFRYASMVAGTSGGQLGSAEMLNGPTELKLGMSLDWLLAQAAPVGGGWTHLMRPTIMKIDVDGLELDILRGAESALSYDSLKHIQIEVNQHTKQIAYELLGHAGFALGPAHDTKAGAEARTSAGEDMIEAHGILFNQTFVRLAQGYEKDPYESSFKKIYAQPPVGWSENE